MSSKYLVLNSGSSSLKFQLFEQSTLQVIAKGLVEKIGLPNSEFHYESSIDKIHIATPIKDHAEALELVSKQLLNSQNGVIQSINEIIAVGHRVVHGGSSFSETTFVTSEVKEKIRELFVLAPLHNPANLEGIEVAEKIFPQSKQIAAFDTAFYHSLEEKVYTYALPLELQQKDQIRLYGFHGLSHKYVSEKAVDFLQKPAARIISIHLGNGCSMTAIQNGKSIDHSLGFGPVTGLVMGTRTGDIDPVILVYLMKKYAYSADDINELITKKSGMLGLTGDSDLRNIQERAENGDKDCQLALEINAYRVKKYIGAFAAALNGIDAIIFTAGIGENSPLLREMICSNMDYLHLQLDAEKNKQKSKEVRAVQTEDSKVQILVVPTNEELEIAEQMKQLLHN